MTTLDSPLPRYGNILEKFQHNRAGVKVTVAVRRKLFNCSGLLIFRLVLILIHTHAYQEHILDRFMF